MILEGEDYRSKVSINDSHKRQAWGNSGSPVRLRAIVRQISYDKNATCSPKTRNCNVQTVQSLSLGLSGRIDGNSQRGSQPTEFCFHEIKIRSVRCQSSRAVPTHMNSSPKEVAALDRSGSTLACNTGFGRTGVQGLLIAKVCLIDTSN